MKKLITTALIALGMLSGSAMAEGNWTKLERIAPSGKNSQPWHPANMEHTDGVIIKHLCQ